MAAMWVDRLTAHDPSPADLSDFRAWIAQSPDNYAAYEQARAIWVDLPRTSLRRRRPPLRLVATGVACAALAAIAFVIPRWHDHVTGTGEIARLVLPDGSTLWLDSASAVDVDFDDKGRTVNLAYGRLALQVAPDPARPLRVQAGDNVISDIGTTFSVDRGAKVKVAVADGIVDIAEGGTKIRLRKGEAASFSERGPFMRAAAPGDFSWRDGRILLDRVRLADAVDTLQRYYGGRIILADPSIAERRISGTLFADRPLEGVAALARSQRLSVTRLPWLVIIRDGD